jgi:hypothetical protein
LREVREKERERERKRERERETRSIITVDIMKSTRRQWNSIFKALEKCPWIPNSKLKKK